MSERQHPLAGRTALVTGATSDIGLAIARGLAEDGATVWAAGRRMERLAALAADHPDRVKPIAFDFTDPAALAAAMEKIGAVDVLVMNAAHPPEKAPLLEGGEANLRAIMETNYFAASRVLLAVLPGMLERGFGRVIHISSLAASIGEAFGPAYCASKSAMDSLMRTCAIDYSPKGVTFNAIECGPLETERMAKWGAAKARRMAMATTVRRLGNGADIAHAVRFLAAPAAGWVTGEMMRVDGGIHLGNPMSAMFIREGSGAGAPAAGEP